MPRYLPCKSTSSALHAVYNGPFQHRAGVNLSEPNVVSGTLSGIVAKMSQSRQFNRTARGNGLCPHIYDEVPLLAASYIHCGGSDNVHHRKLRARAVAKAGDRPARRELAASIAAWH